MFINLLRIFGKIGSNFVCENRSKVCLTGFLHGVLSVGGMACQFRKLAWLAGWLGWLAGLAGWLAG